MVKVNQIVRLRGHHIDGGVLKYHGSIKNGFPIDRVLLKAFGYDDRFIDHMTAVYEKIINDDSVQIEVVDGLDDICRECPQEMKDRMKDLCTSQFAKAGDEFYNSLVGIQPCERYSFSGLQKQRELKFEEWKAKNE